MKDLLERFSRWRQAADRARYERWCRSDLGMEPSSVTEGDIAGFYADQIRRDG